MRTPTLLFLFAFGAAALGAACGDDEPKRPPVLADGPANPGIGGGGITDAGASAEGGARPDAGDAGSCTSLVNLGNDVDQNGVADDVPPGSGGTVLDGIYVLTEARLYLGAAGLPGPTGTRLKETISVAGERYERVRAFTTSGGTSAEIRSSGTFTRAGTAGQIALTCPSVNQETVAYTATPTGLTVSNVVTKESFVYTKQP